MADNPVPLPDVTYPDGTLVMVRDTIDLPRLTVEVTGWHYTSPVGGPRRLYVECADVTDSLPMHVTPGALGLIES